MSEDTFSKQSSGILEQLVIAAAGVGTVALTDDNLAGVAASTLVFGGVQYFKEKASKGNGDISGAEYEILLGYYEKLDARVSELEAKRERLDRQDVLTKQATFSRFARDVTEAATVEKREALVLATAYQFDPEKGSPATRDYWLRRVRALPEAELSFVLLIARHRVGFVQGRTVDLSKYDEAAEQLLPVVSMPEPDVVAYQILAEVMTSRGAEKLIEARTFRLHRDENDPVAHALAMYCLTPAGEQFVSFCRDD